ADGRDEEEGPDRRPRAGGALCGLAAFPRIGRRAVRESEDRAMTEEIREHAAMAAYLAELIEHGLLIPMGVDGLYGRSALFEEMVEGLDKLISGYRKSAEVLRFPPAVSRQAFERGAYLRSFPHLAGTAHSFMGGEREYFAL